MKNNQTNRILSLLGALSAFVAFFCLFAAAFTEEVISVRGNLFQVMFPTSSSGYNMVYPLIGGMILIILAFLVGLIFAFLKEKEQKIGSIINMVFFLAAGILFLLTTNFYLLANPSIDLAATGETSMGAGPICVAIFCFIGAILNGVILFRKNASSSASGKSIKKKA